MSGVLCIFCSWFCNELTSYVFSVLATVVLYSIITLCSLFYFCHDVLCYNGCAHTKNCFVTFLTCSIICTG